MIKWIMYRIYTTGSLNSVFYGFQLLYKESFKHLCTLVERRVIGIIVTTIVKYFCHILDEVSQVWIMASRYLFIH